ncbi:helix-turn-helix transcriptional regulator [Sporosarcina sp. resist]|uniref:helix-turn-helix transcriptional regulator n=1 Tax=Sporosarcina sp. resist TaxID=2762563 RepID=UPI00164DCB28|nr:helix-turn-helix transcriptional regulator [Sporosarcina sp. resist]QNK89397.1 helix-turn-helix transcriptional regulator [Sporosarcina sp. resist]
MMSKDLQTTLIDKRNDLGYSHQDVADHTKITRQFYGMIENGERRPSVEVAKKIGSFLGLDWTIFFEVESNLGLQEKAVV